MKAITHFRRICCQLYAAAEVLWFSKLVYPGAPLVRLLDWSVGSTCKYCMASRALMVGFGLGLGGVIGYAVAAAGVLLAVVERFCSKGE